MQVDSDSMPMENSSNVRSQAFAAVLSLKRTKTSDITVEARYNDSSHRKRQRLSKNDFQQKNGDSHPYARDNPTADHRDHCSSMMVADSIEESNLVMVETPRCVSPEDTTASTVMEEEFSWNSSLNEDENGIDDFWMHPF